MNKNLEGIQESITIQISDLVRQLERKGKKVIKLQTGDPEFETPLLIKEAVIKALNQGYTHYSESRGLPELRTAISQKLKIENNLEYDPESEILITCGGIHAVFCALNALIEPGDEVIIIDPSWMPYTLLTKILGGIPVRIQTNPANNFKLTPELLEQHITFKTKVFIINFPCNPSGVIYTKEELMEFADILKKYKIWVISDEVYEKIIFDDAEHISFASLEGMKERTITVNSFSKTFAMTGWRIEYVAGPIKVKESMLKISQYLITNVPAFIQYGAIETLTNSEIEEYIRNFWKRYKDRRKFLIENLKLHFIKLKGLFIFK